MNKDETPDPNSAGPGEFVAAFAELTEIWRRHRMRVSCSPVVKPRPAIRLVTIDGKYLEERISL